MTNDRAYRLERRLVIIVLACLLVSNLNPLDLLRPSTQQTESDH